MAKRLIFLIITFAITLGETASAAAPLERLPGARMKNMAAKVAGSHSLPTKALSGTNLKETIRGNVKQISRNISRAQRALTRPNSFSPRYRGAQVPLASGIHLPRAEELQLVSRVSSVSTPKVNVAKSTTFQSQSSFGTSLTPEAHVLESIATPAFSTTSLGE